jgi:hypothetical protein
MISKKQKELTMTTDISRREKRSFSNEFKKQDGDVIPKWQKTSRYCC